MPRLRLFILIAIFFIYSMVFPAVVFARPKAFMVIANNTGLNTSTTDITEPPEDHEKVLNDYLSEPPLEADVDVETDIDSYIETEIEAEDYIQPAFFWSLDMVIDKEISKREEGLEMKGIVPELNEEYNPAYFFLNERVNHDIDSLILSAKEAKARLIHFEYEIYYTEALVSIILLSTTTSATSKTEVTSINFEPETGKIIGLTDAAGAGIAPLAEKLLTEMIRRNPDRYNATFDKSNLGIQPFYLTDEHIVLLFNEFQLLASADGIEKLELNLSQIASTTIRPSEYHVQPDGYNIKMVPLRRVCEGLGYDVRWESDGLYIVEVSRDGAIIIELEPGVNNYEVKDKKIRTLEAPPEFVWGMVYVPISFFDQILNLVTYSVDEWDDITFFAYNE